jgi:DNA-binding NarL/FixJ family response regulator
MNKAELSRIVDISPLTITQIAELIHAEEDLRKANDELELRVKKQTKELKAALSEMKRKEEELVKLKIYSEKINKELMETNQALSTLVRNIDREKELLKNRISDTIVTDVMPVITELQNNKTCQRCSADLEVMKIHLNGLISSPTEDQDIITLLTEHEMRVAVLIKKGLSNKKIANMLFISEHTVKTHRRNIRKKLKISDSNINLCSYLNRKRKDKLLIVD